MLGDRYGLITSVMVVVFGRNRTALSQTPDADLLRRHLVLRFRLLETEIRSILRSRLRQRHRRVQPLHLRMTSGAIADLRLSTLWQMRPERSRAAGRRARRYHPVSLLHSHQ
jgi:hypothetical protein